VIVASFLVMIPLVMMLKPVRGGAPAPAVMAE
jgi:hypothetical protein